MANTRPFAYNPGSLIPNTSQSGDLAYGDLNDVNGGPNYSDNPGGVKWWMGPDEDNRYIIGKDVPAMNHPTSTPEGDIGSVRFWGTDSESDLEFLFWFNKLPGRSGLTEVSDPSIAYGWLIANGYYTNYPPVFSELATLFIYQSPVQSTPKALGVLYSPSNNKLFFNTENNHNSNNETYGNFNIPNWTTEIANITGSSNTTKHYSGSSFSTQWLPAQQKPGGNYISSGFMALDDVDDFLFVQGGPGGVGIIKYDISVNPPTIEASNTDDNNANGDYTKIAHERTSNLVISTNGNDSGANNRGFLFDGDDLSFISYLKKSTGTIINYTRWATPGPAGYILLTRESATDYYIFKLDKATDPYRAVDDGSLNTGYLKERDTAQPIYVASKNKWYVPYRKSNSVGKNVNVSLGLDIIDGVTFNRTSTSFGTTQNTTNGKRIVRDPAFFLYDSVRDYFWTTDPIFGGIIAIDADTYSTEVTSNTSGIIAGQQQSATLAENNIILVRKGNENPIKIFDLTSITP